MRGRHLANHQIARQFLVAFPITVAIREFLDVYPALSFVIKSSAISQIVQREFMIGAMDELGPEWIITIDLISNRAVVSGFRDTYSPGTFQPCF